MLSKNEISAWHRINSVDEIWIYLRFAPLSLLCLNYVKKELRKLRIDSNNPIKMIPSRYLQAAKNSGSFSLFSFCVAPGFDFSDFEMLSNLDPSLRQTKALMELI